MSKAMANHAASTLHLRSVAFVPWVVVRLQSVCLRKWLLITNEECNDVADRPLHQAVVLKLTEPTATRNKDCIDINCSPTELGL